MATVSNRNLRSRVAAGEGLGERLGSSNCTNCGWASKLLSGGWGRLSSARCTGDQVVHSPVCANKHGAGDCSECLRASNVSMRLLNHAAILMQWSLSSLLPKSCSTMDGAMDRASTPLLPPALTSSLRCSTNNSLALRLSSRHTRRAAFHASSCLKTINPPTSTSPLRRVQIIANVQRYDDPHHRPSVARTTDPPHYTDLP